VSGTTSPTAAWVDATGIHAPAYADVLNYLTQQYQAIYGSDIVVTPDSQDGQLIGIFALAISDANAACVAVYNSFSPSTAQGVGLSSVVKINGLARAVPSFSTVTLTVVGQAYALITNGAATDAAGQRWLLPVAVEIPSNGQIDVTATAEQPGAITALPATITTIDTPTFGWQSVINNAAASPGLPVESDGALRLRQSQSTANPSETVLVGITGAVLALPGVTSVKPYENDTNVTDGNGLPPHSISLVVEGGDPQAICNTILSRKTPGCYTAGSTRRTSVDGYGLSHDIGFYVAAPVAVGVNISLYALANYSSVTAGQISQAVADYINSLLPGDDVLWSKLWAPADLCNVTGVSSGQKASYDIASIKLGTPVDHTGNTYSQNNIITNIYQTPTCTAADVIVTAGPPPIQATILGTGGVNATHA
jgi:uncharacterized phage protein gp47/JayE